MHTTNILEHIRSNTQSPVRATATVVIMTGHSRNKLKCIGIRLGRQISIPDRFGCLTGTKCFRVSMCTPTDNAKVRCGNSSRLSGRHDTSSTRHVAILDTLNFEVVILAKARFTRRLRLRQTVGTVTLTVNLGYSQDRTFRGQRGSLQRFIVQR